MKLNTLPMLTWRRIKVNDTPLELPSYVSDAFHTLSHDKTSLPPEEYDHWTASLYGISEEALEINRQRCTDLTVMHAKENERLSDKITYRLDNDPPVLLDTHYIIAEKNSTVHLTLDYNDVENSSRSFRNSVIKVLAKEGSNVTVCYVSRSANDNLALCSLVADICKNANVQLIQSEIGSKKSFFHYCANLLEEQASTDINSIYFVNQDRELEIFYHINHIGPKTKSTLSVNGALKDRAKKTFKGTIDFKRGSSESKGSEEEYATLLDDGVRNIAVPILLCQEDNVEGVHAASAGKINEELLFYIMSRGLSPKQAKKIIVESKLTPTLDRISDTTLRDEIWKHIEQEID